MSSKFKLKTGWTKQSVYDTIKERNGGTKCITTNHMGDVVCNYRFEGRACFAGCFIKDEHYNSIFEGRTIEDLLHKYPELNKDMPFDVAGMALLQLVHDRFDGEDLLENLKQWIEDTVDEE